MKARFWPFNKTSSTSATWPHPVRLAVLLVMAAITLLVSFGAWLAYEQRLTEISETHWERQREVNETLVQRVSAALRERLEGLKRIAGSSGRFLSSATRPGAGVDRAVAQDFAAWLLRQRQYGDLADVNTIRWQVGQSGLVSLDLRSDGPTTPGAPVGLPQSVAVETQAPTNQAQLASAAPATQSAEPLEGALWQVTLPWSADSGSAQGKLVFEVDLAAILDTLIVQDERFVHALVNANARVLWSGQQGAWVKGADLSVLNPQAWQSVNSQSATAFQDKAWRWISGAWYLPSLDKAKPTSALYLLSLESTAEVLRPGVLNEWRWRVAGLGLLVWLVLALATLGAARMWIGRSRAHAKDLAQLQALANFFVHAVIFRANDTRVLAANQPGQALLEDGFLPALQATLSQAGVAKPTELELSWLSVQGKNQLHRVTFSIYRQGTHEYELLVAEDQSQLWLARQRAAVAEKTLFDLSVYALLRGDFTIVEANDRFCELIGEPRPQVLGADFRKYLSIEIFATLSFDASWQQLVQGETVHRQMRWRAMHGPIRDLEAVLTPTCDIGGQLRTVAFVARDVSDLAQAKNVAQKLASQIEAVLAMTQSPMLILDKQGYIVASSVRFAGLLGYEAATLKAMSWQELLAPAGQEQAKAALRGAKPGASFSLDMKFLASDGSALDRAVNVSCDSAQGQLFFILELTGQHEVDHLKQRLTSVQSLLDGAAMVLELDAQGRFVGANESWLERFSPKARPSKTESFLHFCPPGFETRLADQSLARAEVVVQDYSGEQVWLDLCALRTRHSDGSLAVLIAARDSSAKVLAQRQISEADARLRTYLDVSAEALWVLDSEGIIRDANAAMCRMLGYTHHAMCGMSVSAIDRGKTLAGFFERAAAQTDSLLTQSFESLFQTANGTLVPVNLKIAGFRSSTALNFHVSAINLTESRQQQQTLASLRAALDATHMVLELDSAGNCVAASASFLKCFGRIESELLGRPVRGFEKAKVLRQRTPGTRGGEDRITSWESELLRFDNTAVWLRSTALLIKRGINQEEGILILSSDITSSMLARQALQQERAFTRSYMESLPVGMFVHDEFGHFTEANMAFCSMLGRSSEEVVGASMFDVELSLSVEELTDLWRNLESNKPFQYEGSGALADGNHVRWAVTLAAVQVGSERRFFGSVRDLTKDLATEGVIDRQRQALNLTHMVLRLNADWRIVEANDKYLERLGLSMAELIGQDWDELSEVDTKEKSSVGRRLRMNVLKKGQPIQLELMQHTKSLEEVWMLASYVPSLNEIGEIESIAVFALDVTDQRNSEVRLRESQKLEAVGQLTGGLAHDFNNMLGIVLGNLELMEPNLPPDDETLIECFNAARQAATRGASVANSLLAVARRQKLDLTRVDINESLQSLIALLGHSVGASARLSGQLCAGPLVAMLDDSGFSNVVLNLVINARDAMAGQSGPKAIELRSDRVVIESDHPNLPPGEYARVEVKDNGPGMAPEVQRRAFDPFFTTKEQGKGTGLGLAMVKGFVEQLGGAVTIDTAPDSGTTVSLLLPLLSEQASEWRRREAQRLAALEELAVLDTEPDEQLDELVRQAAGVCGAKTALISLVDKDRQWFKAKVGLDATQTPRRDAFCAHAIESADEIFEIPDAMEDQRFSANPLVVGNPYIRFYAGVPLADAKGHLLGTLCVLDDMPKELSDVQRDQLLLLAQQAAIALQTRPKIPLQPKALAQQTGDSRPLGASDVPSDKPAPLDRPKLAPARSSSSSVAPEVRNELSVLVVDDEDGLCRIARKWLESMGYRVEATTAAGEALTMLSEQHFDVLFTDIVMPGDMDGHTLAQKALEIAPHMQVVLTTGYSPSTESVDQARVLRKPYSRADVQRIFGELRDQTAPDALRADAGGADA